jgi:CDP-diacylglycerol--serine O-phosphatidyltransferase
MAKSRIVPSLVSFLNLFCGFWAITLIGRGQFANAAWFIIIAAIFDGLDGAVARLVRGTSRYGVELDSLVDIVSFGAAPASLLYFALLQPLGTPGLLIAFVPLLAGLLRLARYNVLNAEPAQKKGDFVGLPITSAAIVMVSFYLYMSVTHNHQADLGVWLGLIAVLSLLMVSPIPYQPLPGVRIKGSNKHWFSVSFIIVVAVAVIWNPALTIFPIMILYTLSGPTLWGWSHLRKLKVAVSEDEATRQMVPARKRRPSRRRRREPL